MQLDGYLSRLYTHRHAAHEHFFTYNFSDFSLASHSLIEEEIMEELFRRDDDGSCLVELDNFVTEIRTAQADFQAVLGGATDDDFDEPRVEWMAQVPQPPHETGENPKLMILFIIMLVLTIMVSFTKTPCILDALRFFWKNKKIIKYWPPKETAQNKQTNKLWEAFLWGYKFNFENVIFFRSVKLVHGAFHYNTNIFDIPKKIQNLGDN